MTKARAVAAVILLLVLANAGTFAFLLSEQGQINTIVTRQGESVRRQLANRTANVGIWCSALNAQRTYARLRAVENHQTPYTLPNLDCAQLEAQTAQSAHPK